MRSQWLFCGVISASKVKALKYHPKAAACFADISAKMMQNERKSTAVMPEIRLDFCGDIWYNNTV